MVGVEPTPSLVRAEERLDAIHLRPAGTRSGLKRAIENMGQDVAHVVGVELVPEARVGNVEDQRLDKEGTDSVANVTLGS